MIPAERLKHIRTMQDLRVEKARLRYESLMAEKDLNDSVEAIGKVMTFFTLFRRAAGGARYAYGIFSRVSDYLGGLFKKKSRKGDGGDDSEPDVVTY